MYCIYFVVEITYNHKLIYDKDELQLELVDTACSVSINLFAELSIFVIITIKSTVSNWQWRIGTRKCYGRGLNID